MSEPASSQAALGNWYVNLLTIDRRKTLIFMSERTLLSFLLFGVRKDNAKNLGELFTRGLVQLLELEEFTEQHIRKVFGMDGLITISRTNDRQALGNMNDLMRMYEFKIRYGGGFQHCDLWDVIRSTNRTPQRTIGGGYSIDLARKLVA